MAEAMVSKTRLILWTTLLSTSFKVLMIPSYRSTDFEVHRNWLAITHSKPVSLWYYEDTSEWTLDYPPYFAWFEYLLSHIAKYFDSAMLDVTNLNYASKKTILFQRLSVIVVDLAFSLGVYRISSLEKSNTWPAAWIIIMLMSNCGLFIVDSIHFQYNAVLLGILLLSLCCMAKRQYLAASALFAFLLNMKHIFLYVAPAYFVFLLRHHCLQGGRDRGLIPSIKHSTLRFLSLGLVVTSVFALSLAPFLITGQTQQLFLRLFPTKRGLCHSYWAANVWALYNAVDKLLSSAGHRLGLYTSADLAVMTGGLVGEAEHTVLPNIKPSTAGILTLLSMMQSFYCVWIGPNSFKTFLHALVSCAYSSFLFGYHVHEKAVLLIIIPLSILAVQTKLHCRVFLLVSVAGHVALMPLLFQGNELPIKVLLVTSYTVIILIMSKALHGCWNPCIDGSWVGLLETSYLLGTIPVQLFCLLVHPLMASASRYPFLPLMATSVYSAIGVVWSYLVFSYSSLHGNSP